jgi:acetoin utilization deacetylase AcuC-like enzyme
MQSTGVGVCLVGYDKQMIPIMVQASDLDVYLDEGAGDEEYMAAMEAHIPRVIAELKPQLVFFQAGVSTPGLQ